MALGAGGRRGSDTIICAIEGNRRHRDGGLSRQFSFNFRISRVASYQAKAMTVGLNHHLDKVRVIERRRGVGEGRLVKIPGRRPELPEQSSDRLPVFLQARTAAFAVAVLLVP